MKKEIFKILFSVPQIFYKQIMNRLTYSVIIASDHSKTNDQITYMLPSPCQIHTYTHREQKGT